MQLGPHTGKKKDSALIMVPEILDLTRETIMVGRKLSTSWLTAYEEMIGGQVLKGMPPVAYFL